MSADRLRAAARKIRDTATEAAKPENCHPWGDERLPPATTPKAFADAMRGYLGGPWGELAALMASPPVALAVADWLDTAGADLWAHGPLHCATGCHECDDVLWAPHVRDALTIADLVLGGAE